MYDAITHHNGGNIDQDLFDDIQQDYNRWKLTLKIISGKMSEEKITYYVIDWAFSIWGKPTMVDGFGIIDSTQRDQFEARQIKITDHHK